MRKVMVAYDGSDSANRALQYIVDFSKESTSPLDVHVLNVQQEPILFGEYVTADMVEEMRRDMLAEADKIVQIAEVRLKAADIACHVHTALGNVAEQVREAVEREGCDTVVMGTRGLGSLSGLLMGSVATRVIHEVSVPVLLVK